VGWSDGATVGLLVALRRPDFVHCLVYIGQQLNPEALRPQARAMTARETMPSERLPPMLKDLYGAVSPDGPGHWDVVVEKLWRRYRTEPNILLGELAAVTAPTLVVLAEHDFPTPEHGEAMQQALPDARLEVVPGASHGLPMEQPGRSSPVWSSGSSGIPPDGSAPARRRCARRALDLSVCRAQTNHVALAQ